jgi:hypothetical protein
MSQPQGGIVPDLSPNALFLMLRVPHLMPFS